MKELGLDIGMVISQVVNFGLLAALLYTFLHKPILSKLEERAARIRKGIDDAERGEALLAEANAAYEAEMERARREAYELIAEARRDADEQREQILARAKQEAEELLVQAREQVREETAESQLTIHRQVVDLAMAAASQLIHETLDEEKHRELVRDFLSEAGRLQ